MVFLDLRLMTRDQFIPVKQLNLLAAGWIQFQLHDWFDHGPVDTSRRIDIDLDKDDPVYGEHHGKISIPRTKPDNCPSNSVQRELSACLFSSHSVECNTSDSSIPNISWKIPLNLKLKVKEGTHCLFLFIDDVAQC